MRYATLKELDEAGVDVRLWCFACGRGAEIDAIIWWKFRDRGWPMELELAARRFTCSSCRSSADVLIVPATRPKRPPATAADLVAAFFHQQRSLAKKARQALVKPVPRR